MREFTLILLLAGGMVLGAELLARICLGPQGNAWEYWDYASVLKFEYYRTSALQENLPTVLVLGDSTAARDLSPEAMQRYLPADTSAYNLASPANFPMAFRCTTIPLLKIGASVSKIVILQFNPASLIEGYPGIESFEQGILESPVCMKQAGNNFSADFLYLARLGAVLDLGIPIHHKRMGRGWPINDPPDQLGFMPLAPARRALNGGQIAADSVSISDERFAVILETAKIVHDKGSSLVIIIPPIYGEYNKVQTGSYLEALNAAAIESELTIIDGQMTPGLESWHFYDEVHLNENGAVLFSEYIAKWIALLLSLEEH